MRAKRRARKEERGTRKNSFIFPTPWFNKIPIMIRKISLDVNEILQTLTKNLKSGFFEKMRVNLR
jgi:hypothetical protein